MNSPMIVLAGGFGTRLRSVVADVPKPMAPINGTPFLALQLQQWIAQGQKQFIFSLHHQSEIIIDFLKQAQNDFLKDIDVRWVVEPKPLGTGGAIAYVGRTLTLQGDVLIGNADTWLGKGLPDLTQTPAPALGVITVPNVARFGSVEMDDDHRVIKFCEKNPNPTAQQSGNINGGLYKLPIQSFYDVPHDVFSVEVDVLPKFVDAQNLKAVPVSGPFFDIGVPDDYAAFINWFTHIRVPN